MKELKLMDTDNPPFDEEERRRIESLLMLSLPRAYIDLLRRWNGGRLEEAYKVRVDKPIPEELRYYLGEGFWGIHSMPGIAGSSGSPFNLKYMLSLAKEWELPENVVPLDGDGHTWVALDYRDPSTPEPTVIFIESEHRRSFVLATSFEEFLERLIPYHEVYDPDGNIIYKP